MTIRSWQFHDMDEIWISIIFFSDTVFAVRWVVYPTKYLLFFLSTRCWRDADALSNHLPLREGLPYQKLKTNLMNYCNVDSCGWESQEILETSFAFVFYGSESEGYLGRLLVENLMDHKSWENLEIYFVQFRFLWINISRNASIFLSSSSSSYVLTAKSVHETTRVTSLNLHLRTFDDLRYYDNALLTYFSIIVNMSLIDPIESNSDSTSLSRDQILSVFLKNTNTCKKFTYL